MQFRASMKVKRKVPKSVEEYLAALHPGQRKELERLRGIIRQAAPDAEEAMSYGMPAFKHNGPLVYYAAFEDHFSFFPGGKWIIKKLGDDLKPFKTFGGTIQFTAEHPMPSSLVKKIVKLRLKENEERAKKRGR